MADEIQKIKVSELPTASSLANLAILGVDLSTNSSVKALMSLLKGLDGKSVEIQNNGTHLQWRQTGGTWADLVAVADLKGATGSNIELQKTSTHLQWRVVGGAWANLVVLEDLKVKGDTGASIEMQVTATYVQWRVVGSGTWSNLIAISELKGGKGDDARQVEFQKSSTHLQWRLVGDTAWTNLVPLSDLKGAAGSNIELQKTSTHLQWRVVGGTWANLVALEDLKVKGDTGATPIISMGTVATIPAGGQSSATLTDDGVDANGVKKYKLNLTLVQGATGTVENIDTLAITFTQASSRANINTGETFSTLFGKIRKWFADLGSLAFKSSVAKSDLDSSVQESLGKADSALQSFTESDPTVPSWAKAASKPSYSATEVGALPNSHNSDASSHADIRNELAGVRLIAEGSLRGQAFDTVADMESWLAVESNRNSLKIGNPLYIRATEVSDYWWDGSQALESESEKVDLSGYLLVSVANSTYVLKESGKSLMTDAERTKLNGIAAGATALSLGETSSTAYRGDRGKTAYDHSQSTHAPSTAQKNSDITKAEIEAKLTGNITTHTHDLYLESAKVQVVASLPGSPVAGTYYFIPE